MCFQGNFGEIPGKISLGNFQSFFVISEKFQSFCRGFRKFPFIFHRKVVHSPGLLQMITSSTYLEHSIPNQNYVLQLVRKKISSVLKIHFLSVSNNRPPPLHEGGSVATQLQSGQTQHSLPRTKTETPQQFPRCLLPKKSTRKLRTDKYRSPPPPLGKQPFLGVRGSQGEGHARGGGKPQKKQRRGCVGFHIQDLRVLSQVPHLGGSQTALDEAVEGPLRAGGTSHLGKKNWEKN